MRVDSNVERNETRFRLLKAVAIVLAIVLSAPGVSTLAHIGADHAEAVGVMQGIDAQALTAGSTEEALDRIEKLAFEDRQDAPSYFEEEVGLLANCRDVRVGAGGSVVSYVVEGDCETVLGMLVEHMEQRGWVAVPLGSANGYTFSKQNGSCTWALATCTQSGDAVSVVFRCLAS